MSDVKKSCVKRRPRIIAIQKKLMVQLLENYFIRATGKCSNVNFDAIKPSAFERFAEILNTWGPSKTSSEWKSSFYYMKNRIRRSVEMILQSNASVKDNLSELDYKLYSMSPSWFHGAVEAGESNIELNNDFGYYAEEEVPDTDFVKEETSRDLDRYAEDHLSSDAVEGETNDPDFMDFGCYTDEPLNNDPVEELGSENFQSEYGSRGVLVAETAEELENYMNSPIILSEDEEFLELIPSSTGTIIPSENCNVVTLEECPSKSNKTVLGPSSFSKQVQCAPKKGQIPKSSTTIVKSNPAAKVGSKIPELQKERLIQLVQNNFMKAFGRFAGANGANIKAQFWEATAKELNTLGPPRTGKQWKMTFNNIKTSAKSKLADDHNNIGGLVTKPLTRLEEKVLSIYGMNALDGTQELGEAGFRYKKTVPVVRRACESTIISGALANPENQDAPLEGSIDSDLETDNHPEAASPGCSDNSVLRELINEIWKEPITNELLEAPQNASITAASKSAAVEVSSRNQLEMLNRETDSFATRSENNYNSSSSRLRGHSAYHSHGSSHDHNSKSVRIENSSSTQSRENSIYGPRGSSNVQNSGRPSRISQNNFNYSNRSREPSNGVRGVPHLHVRRRSSSEQLEETTNMNQLIDHGHSAEKSSRNGRVNRSSRPRNADEGNNDQTARVDRDRSSLRHTVPVFRRVCESTVTSGALSSLACNPTSQETTAEGSTDSYPGIENSTNSNVEVASPDSLDNIVPNDPINEFLEEPITNETLETHEKASAAAGEMNIRSQSEIGHRELHNYASRSENHYSSSSSRLRGHSADHSRGSSRGHSKATKSVRMENSSSTQSRENSIYGSRGSSHVQNSGRPSCIPRNCSRGTSHGVRGVPRLHVRRRRRSSAEQMEEITDINQLFHDEDSDEENSPNIGNESNRANTSSRPRNTNEENADRTVATVERDRSNLRHRFTSFEMVQQSMDAQERFIADSNRNHSELMYTTDRNHLEMIGIFNATLRSLANVAQQFVNKM